MRAFSPSTVTAVAPRCCALVALRIDLLLLLAYKALLTARNLSPLSLQSLSSLELISHPSPLKFTSSAQIMLKSRAPLDHAHQRWCEPTVPTPHNWTRVSNRSSEECVALSLDQSKPDLLEIWFEMGEIIGSLT